MQRIISVKPKKTKTPPDIVSRFLDVGDGNVLEIQVVVVNGSDQRQMALAVQINRSIEVMEYWSVGF